MSDAPPTEIRVLGDFGELRRPRPGLCRSCGRSIVWFTTAGELRPMPVDAEPAFTVTRRYAEAGKIRSIIRAVPHWVTCPEAKQWRRHR